MSANGTVVFRADASIEIGTGHVMRCLTLADRLRAAGLRCRFVSRDHRGALTAFVRGRGHAVDVLPAASQPSISDGPAHEAWLGADWRTDAQQTLQAIGEERPAWLVVDHYGADARWESVLRPACGRMLVVDDLADRAHACDVLLDQNLGHDRASYARLVPPACTVLTGPVNALLRSEFARWRAHSLQRRASPALRRILVTMGGMDKDNATGAVLRALPACRLPEDCRIRVVLGPQAPWRELVTALAASLPLAIEVIPGTDDMARLMAESDFAIGAAGSTSWERCALGLPAAVVVLAENQRGIAQALDGAGAALAVDLASLAVALRRLLRYPGLADRLTRMSAAAAALTDGHGAQRVADCLLERETA